jgi:hypothetical protein
MGREYRRRLALVIGLAGMIGCATKGTSSPRSEGVVFEDRLVIDEHDDRSPLGIAPAHLPPPGSCRVWQPGRPPAQQPRPQACDQAEASAPQDSWILNRRREDPRLIHVTTVDRDAGGELLRVRVYDAERGTYLGTRQPKRVPTR